MKQSRRNFIRTLAASSGLLHIQGLGASTRPTTLELIDRAALINRHSPVMRKIDPSDGSWAVRWEKLNFELIREI